MERAQILEAISGMTVLELSQLIKDMEEKFGVSAAADTPNFSSMSLMSCDSSRTVMPEIASRICARSIFNS